MAQVELMATHPKILYVCMQEGKGELDKFRIIWHILYAIWKMYEVMDL